VASLIQKAVQLQEKKREAAKLRRIGELEFKKAKSLANRSVSGLVTLQRKIESSKEALEDVSGVLTQRLAQQESIQRLVAAAEEHLKREKEAKEQTEQELEFAESEEEKSQAKARLQIISERIDELIEEIKQRSNTFKKITKSIEDYKKSTSQLTGKIQKQTHSKPTLKNLIKTSKKATVRIAKQVSRQAKQEELAKQTLEKINKKLSELAAKRQKIAAKKKKSKIKRKSKVRKGRSKTKKTKGKSKIKRKSKVRKGRSKTKKTKGKSKIKRKSKVRKRK
jgi:chromosome segregation ATPase